MLRFLAIGECMIELSNVGGDGLLKQSFAGDTFNTAWYASALASSYLHVEYLTALGTDQISENIIAFMTKSQIGSSHITRVSNRHPGIYMIHLKNGERSFSYWRENSAARLLAEDVEHLDDAIQAADIIYYSGITLAILPPNNRDALISAASKARDNGKLVIFDPNLRPGLWPSIEEMKQAVRDAASRSSIVMPGFEDEAKYFSDFSPNITIKRYTEYGAYSCVVKDGGNGVYLSINGEVLHVEAHPAATIVDTTAAGDSFNAAYIAALCDNRSNLEAAAIATRVAASVIGQQGALVPVRSLQNFMSM